MNQQGKAEQTAQGNAMIRLGRWLICSAALLLAACASTPAPVQQNVRIEVADAAAGDAAHADVQRVIDGIHMVGAGHIQAAIDGPFKVIDVGDVGYMPANMLTGATGDSECSLAIPGARTLMSMAYGRACRNRTRRTIAFG
jgi:hypothetical protein